jgi:hypothetical protein
MKFDEFYTLQEIGKIQDMPATGISDIQKIKQSHNEDEPQYDISFTVDDSQYYVVFTLQPLELVDKAKLKMYHITDDCYAIDFFGPESLDLTGKGTPHQVYTKMLLAIKKFFSQFTVNAIMVAPSEKKMKLVYAKFLQRFLPDFARVQLDAYVRKSFIETLDEETKQVVEKKIQEWAGKDEISQIRKQENLKRLMSQNIKSSAGKLVLYFKPPEMRPEVGVVRKVLSDRAVEIVSKPSTVHPQMISYADISNIRPINHFQMTVGIKQQIDNLQQMFSNKLKIWEI